MSSYKCIGVMSGTSLDGVDVCCAEFVGDLDTDVWTYRIITGRTLPYSDQWAERLRLAQSLSGEDLIRLHVDYGHFIGQTVRSFIDDMALTGVHAVACHGHTVFHQPERRFTFQIGDGETIAAYVRCPVVNNFRSKDVALGGQGAPLVPIGEAYLFSSYDVCLNLGGIANVTLIGVGSMRCSRCMAFDISPCNVLLNYLSQRLESGPVGYDDRGSLAESGSIIDSVLSQLNALSYYQRPPPKSLGREWFEKHVIPIVDFKLYSIKDLLRTAVEHIATQIGRAIASNLDDSSPRGQTSPLRLLVTGGGHGNTFLVRRIVDCIKQQVPGGVCLDTDCDPDTVNFKEALIFAFLGLRSLLGVVNVDGAVTGASLDTISGAIHMGTCPASLASRCAMFDQMRVNLRKNSSSSSMRESSRTMSPQSPPPIYEAHMQPRFL